VVAQVVKEVAQHLGHTPAVCRASYVHPRVIETFLAGELAERGAGSARAGAWPPTAEKAFVRLISA